MARYRGRVRTPRSPDEVFALLADLSRFDEWDPGIGRAEQVEGDGPRVGAVYEMDTSGRTFRYVIEQLDPPRFVHAVGTASHLVSHDRITVEPDGEGSVVTYDADLQPQGLLRVADPVLKLVFDRIAKRSMAGLATQLEGRVVDG